MFATPRAGPGFCPAVLWWDSPAVLGRDPTFPPGLPGDSSSGLGPLFGTPAHCSVHRQFLGLTAWSIGKKYNTPFLLLSLLCSLFIGICYIMPTSPSSKPALVVVGSSQSSLAKKSEAKHKAKGSSKARPRSVVAKPYFTVSTVAPSSALSTEPVVLPTLRPVASPTQATVAHHFPLSAAVPSTASTLDFMPYSYVPLPPSSDSSLSHGKKSKSSPGFFLGVSVIALARLATMLPFFK